MTVEEVGCSAAASDVSVEAGVPPCKRSGVLATCTANSCVPEAYVRKHKYQRRNPSRRKIGPTTCHSLPAFLTAEHLRLA